MIKQNTRRKEKKLVPPTHQQEKESFLSAENRWHPQLWQQQVYRWMENLFTLALKVLLAANPNILFAADKSQKKEKKMLPER